MNEAQMICNLNRPGHFHLRVLSPPLELLVERGRVEQAHYGTSTSDNVCAPFSSTFAMIKLIIIARCIPEDVYLRSLEQAAPVLVGEKKFSIVVRDPESWYIGRLAIEIKSRYESIYKR